MCTIETNIFLIGPMGVGKTSVGKQLAKRLSMDFFDSDAEIEEIAGMSITALFTLSGEACFRQYERQVIATLVQKKNSVLATGGGAVLDNENCQNLAACGFVVYLTASLEKLLAQTRLDKTRPLLQCANPRRTISHLLEQRKPLYQQIADVTIDTSVLAVHDVVHTIYEHIVKK